MTHSLLELNAMTQEQLVELAKSLNIKNTKKMNEEQLGFAILDEEAKIESLKAPLQTPVKRKRGRPRKEEAAAPKQEKEEKQAKPAKAEQPVEKAAEAPQEEQTKQAKKEPRKPGRKPGRKPKQAETPEQPAAETAQKETPAAPKPQSGGDCIQALFNDLDGDISQKGFHHRQKQSQKPQQNQKQQNQNADQAQDQILFL